MRDLTSDRQPCFIGLIYLSMKIFAMVVGPVAASGQTGIQFNISDSAGRPLPCRIHVKNDQDQPQKALGQPFWRDHFVCDGRVAVGLEPGRYTWQIERGPEHARESGQVDVAEAQRTTVDLTLPRISNLRSQGWYSGDLHVHRPPNEIERLMRAEDLDFAPVITWWNSRNAWQDRSLPDKTTIKFDEHRIYTLMAGEDEREGGALLYFGLKQPLPLPDRRKSPEFPSPMRFVDQARQRDPEVWIDIEKPFWWDVPTWLASGKMNSIGIANNHMCRSRMLANEAWGRPRNVARLPNPRGNGFWTQEIYYHALSAGLRIPPSAGSASGVLPNPVGYNRVYVHLGDDAANGKRNAAAAFQKRDWLAALRRGRCFVTNGPLLIVRANGDLPGAVFQSADQQDFPVGLSVQLTSADRVAALEVIHNGRIIKEIACSDDVSQQVDVDLSLNEPGWFLVRAITDVENTFRFASTAPWYIESDSIKHRISKTSAQFFHDWVSERIERIQKNIADAEQRRAVLAPHERSRQFWANRVQQANAELAGDPPNKNDNESK